MADASPAGRRRRAGARRRAAADRAGAGQRDRCAGASRAARPSSRPYRFDDAGWVANRWCEILPISLAAKQKLMELADPQVRLRLVDEYLRGKGVGPVSSALRSARRRFSRAACAPARAGRRASASTLTQRAAGHGRLDARARRAPTGAPAGPSAAVQVPVEVRQRVVDRRQRLGRGPASGRERRAVSSSVVELGQAPQAGPDAALRALHQPHALAVAEPQQRIAARAAPGGASSPGSVRGSPLRARHARVAAPGRPGSAAGVHAQRRAEVHQALRVGRDAALQAAAPRPARHSARSWAAIDQVAVEAERSASARA